ncbi:hypothetical protein [Gilvibacter sp.]|uniref:hypothetical protein n=1 Tax=Gilvibacter sp. TaxID=2729997 RepID=UPI003F4A60F8
MRIFYYLSIFFLFTAFLCESDEPLEVEETSIFPEAAPSEIAIQIEDAIIVFPAVNVLGNIGSQCGDPVLLKTFGVLTNPDFSNVVFEVLLVDPAVELFDQEENFWQWCDSTTTDRDFGLRLRMWYNSSDGTTNEFYHADPSLGGSGYLDVTLMEFPDCSLFPDIPPGQFTATFEVVMHRAIPDEGPGVMPLNIRGSFNLIPIGCSFGTAPYL